MNPAGSPWLPATVSPVPEEDVERVVTFLRSGDVLVMTGAGCSTESGIPDYRGPVTGRTQRSPLTWQQFSRDAVVRRRYWSRAMRGWPAFRSACPGAAHHALSALADEGLVTGIVTQNVDGLHQRAGHEETIELHGSLARVECRGCGVTLARDWLQSELERYNPGWALALSSDRMAPDGDADAGGGDLDQFRVVDCPNCGGLLKPGVVMFGENIPPAVKESALALWRKSRALLIVGSSLSVYSGYRFIQWASREGKPAALINLGQPARGIDKLDWHVDGLAGECLARCGRVLGVDLSTGG